MNKQVEKHLSHTTSFINPITNDQYLFIKERIRNLDNSITTNLRKIKNPKRSYYVTKPKYRTYTYSKEIESLEHLDEYLVPDCQLYSHLKKVLGLDYHPHVSYSDLMNNPYVYGADIDVETLYRMQYIYANQDNKPIPFTKAFLDIEIDLKTDKISIISITSKKHIEVIINKHCMKNCTRPVTAEDIEQAIQRLILERLKKEGYDYNIVYVDTELDLIKYNFDYLHTKAQPDFVCVWNMDFDVPYLVDRLRINNQDPINYFSDPSLSREERFFNYKKDTYQRDHYALKWHWVTAPATFQWIDSYTLYPWCRRTQPYEKSYKLDYIMNKYTSYGKLFNIDNHYAFQQERFDEYVAYNIIDTLGFAILEEQQLRDIEKLTSVKARLADFSSSNKRLRAEYYYTYKQLGYIIASSAGKSKLPYQHLLPNIGGAVVKLINGLDIGLNVIEENPILRTLVCILVNDGDFTSVYPSITRGWNISNATHLYSPTKFIGELDNKDISDFFARIIMMKENAVGLGSEYFNLPSYQEMFELLEDIQYECD